ncbi:MAG: hypothetical protein LBV49_03910 [Azonexus sp.]|jgi:hypothetical protein|nr:hypothetical protein [Azonexus sp.]
MAEKQSDAIAGQNRERLATPGGVVVMTLAGAVVLLLLCSHGLAEWADRQYPELAPYAHWLDEALAQVGLSAFYDALRSLARMLAGAA